MGIEAGSFLPVSALQVISIWAVVVNAPSSWVVTLAEFDSDMAVPCCQDASALELLANLANSHLHPDQQALALCLCHNYRPLPRRVLLHRHNFFIQGSGRQHKKIRIVKVQRGHRAIAELQPGTDQGLLWKHTVWKKGTNIVMKMQNAFWVTGEIVVFQFISIQRYL